MLRKRLIVSLSVSLKQTLKFGPERGFAGVYVAIALAKTNDIAILKAGFIIYIIIIIIFTKLLTEIK